MNTAAGFDIFSSLGDVNKRMGHRVFDVDALELQEESRDGGRGFKSDATDTMLRAAKSSQISKSLSVAVKK